MSGKRRLEGQYVGCRRAPIAKCRDDRLSLTESLRTRRRSREHARQERPPEAASLVQPRTGLLRHRSLAFATMGGGVRERLDTTPALFDVGAISSNSDLLGAGQPHTTGRRSDNISAEPQRSGSGGSVAEEHRKSVGFWGNSELQGVGMTGTGRECRRGCAVARQEKQMRSMETVASEPAEFARPG